MTFSQEGLTWQVGKILVVQVQNSYSVRWPRLNRAADIQENKQLYYIGRKGWLAKIGSCKTWWCKNRAGVRIGWCESWSSNQVVEMLAMIQIALL